MQSAPPARVVAVQDDSVNVAPTVAAGGPTPPPPPLPTATTPHTTEAAQSNTTHGPSRPSPPPPPPTPLPPARLYAPLFSLLNPIEDSSVPTAAAATAATVATASSDDDTVAGSAAEAEAPRDAAGNAAAPLLTSAHSRGTLSSAPSSEHLMRRHHGPSAATTAAPPHATRAGRWWAAFKQLCCDVHVEGAREIRPIDEPRRFLPSERVKMARYESVDTYEAESMLYKDYLETRSHEPRWFMWVFVLVLGIGTSALALGMAACLHVLNSIRYELLGFGLRHFSFADAHRYANSSESGTGLDAWAMLKGRNVGLYGIARPLSYGGGCLMLLLFALCTSAVASGVCYLVPESVGSGVPEVKAYLNGVSYPMMRSTRVLVAKVVAVVFTVASGVCTGHYGHLMLAGAMLGAQLLQRRHGLRCYHVHFVDCFRNPRDRRVILVIGAAAGIASAFCVSVGGLLVILELLSAVFPVRFALYVFAACLLSTLCTQVYLSYWVNFDTRYRPIGSLHHGELLSEAVVLFRTHLPFGEHPAMNLLDFAPALFIGLSCGACAVVFVRVSWAALYCRRRLEVALGTKAIRYVLPILFTLVYVSLHYWIAVAFTHVGPAETPAPSPPNGSESSTSENALLSNSAHPIPEVCRPVPYAVRSGRNVTTISFYGMTGFLCPASATVQAAGNRRNSADYAETLAFHDGSAMSTDAPRVRALHIEQSVRVVDAYASLALSDADSTLQTLLSQRTAELLPWRALVTFSLIYFFASAMYSGLALCGDTLLPSLVIGAAIGRCIGAAVYAIAVRVGSGSSGAAAATAGALSWADPGVFALFGAGSFVSATSGLSFGIGAILIESTADFRHLLPLMFAILVARRVLMRWSSDVLTVYLEARAVPLLNAESYMERYTLLDARHVMHSPVVALPVVCLLDDIARVLRETRHCAFPVVSVNDGTCKGIVTRAQLELLLWHLIMTQGRVTQCTYDVLQRVEDHVFHNRWEGADPTEALPMERLRSTQISLYPYVDTSAFTVLDTTALPRTYEMFTTLGLRHLIVVDRANYALGMITRKDLTGDHLSRVQERDARGGDGVQSGNQRGRSQGVATTAAAFATLRCPLHPSHAQVAEVARNSSTRRLQRQQEQQQHQTKHSSPAMTQHPPWGTANAHCLPRTREEECYARAVRRASQLQLSGLGRGSSAVVQ